MARGRVHHPSSEHAYRAIRSKCRFLGQKEIRVVKPSVLAENRPWILARLAGRWFFVLDTKRRGMVGTSHRVNNRCHGMYDKKARNPADFPVLGILYSGPAHGYDLRRELKERLGEVWTLGPSHIYALLAGLEKDGLVRHDRVDQEARPAKKVFNITDQGRLVFLAWVRSPVMNVRDIRLEFLAKLHFTTFDSATAVADLITSQLAVCRSSQQRLIKNRARCRTETECSTLDFRLAMLEATVAWLVRLLPPDRRRLEETG
jgi:PadR family transcriptional regulator, regulatory protein AphA